MYAAASQVLMSPSTFRSRASAQLRWKVWIIQFTVQQLPPGTTQPADEPSCGIDTPHGRLPRTSWVSMYPVLQSTKLWNYAFFARLWISQKRKVNFYPCDAMLARYGPVSVSVCPSQAGIVSKRLNGSSEFWHIAFFRLVLHFVHLAFG